jgi:hypothetical protein
METRAGLDAMTLMETEVSSFASQSVKVRTDTLRSLFLTSNYVMTVNIAQNIKWAKYTPELNVLK